MKSKEIIRKKGISIILSAAIKATGSRLFSLYGDITLEEIYSGIDVKYYYDGNAIRYDYKIKPGADLSQLKLKFDGEESLSINESGELVIKTILGEVIHGKLYSYQMFNGEEKKSYMPVFSESGWFHLFQISGV